MRPHTGAFHTLEQRLPRHLLVLSVVYVVAACIHVERPRGGLPFARQPISAIAGPWMDGSTAVQPDDGSAERARVSLAARLGLARRPGANTEAGEVVHLSLSGNTLIASWDQSGSSPAVRFLLVPDAGAGGYIARRLGPRPPPQPGNPLVGYQRETLRLGLTTSGSLRLERQETALGLVYLMLPVYVRTVEVAWYSRPAHTHAPRAAVSAARPYTDGSVATRVARAEA